MGCDIHIHVEAKFKDKWHHLHYVQGVRIYQVFADIARVRGDGRGIWQGRGIPDDATEITRLYWQLDEGKCVHNASWASDYEVGDFNYLKGSTGWFEREIMNHYFHFGDFLDSWVRFPEHYEFLSMAGYQGARIVFWFDN